MIPKLNVALPIAVLQCNHCRSNARKRRMSLSCTLCLSTVQQTRQNRVAANTNFQIQGNVRSVSKVFQSGVRHPGHWSVCAQLCIRGDIPIQEADEISKTVMGRHFLTIEHQIGSHWHSLLSQSFHFHVYLAWARRRVRSPIERNMHAHFVCFAANRAQ